MGQPTLRTIDYRTYKSRNMKQIFTLLLSICLLDVMVFAQDRAPYLTKSLSGNNVNAVYARTSGGNIQVTGVSASEARIEVYISDNGKNLSKYEVTKRLKEDYELTVEMDGNKL